jgi:hypothetical protein
MLLSDAKALAQCSNQVAAGVKSSSKNTTTSARFPILSNARLRCLHVPADP